MQIKKITVKKLFGTRDFSLSLKNGHGFFYGENGAGKTTFLNVTYALLSGQESLIDKDLQYDEFEIEFDNGKKIKDFQVFTWPKIEDDMNPQDKSHVNSFNNHLNQYINYLESIKINYPLLENIEVQEIINEIKNENTNILIKNNTLYQNIQKINISISRDLGNPNPNSWFNNSINQHTALVSLKKRNNIKKTKEILNNIQNDILFLNVYRNRPKVKLTQLNSQSENNLYEEGNIILASQKLNELKQKVQDSALEIKKLINSYYIDMSNSLLDKLLTYNGSEEISLLPEEDKNIIPKIFEYIQGIDDSKKVKLQEILLGDSDDLVYKILLESFKPFIIEYRKNALPIEDNIDKFTTIINKYLVHKEITFDKKDFKFTLKMGSKEKDLDEKYLSSGEKHIFSIFSNLVFNKKENIHLLIDEPELSLSINWQKMFIDDIISFNKVKNLIFVTHSPYVISQNMEDDLQKFPSGN